MQSLFEVVSLYKSLIFLGILCPSSPRPGPSFGVAEAKGARNSSRGSGAGMAATDESAYRKGVR